jgi:protein-disulfide isomerase-like protein with CxxC motif
VSAIDVTLFTDPTCPWAYSEIPALRVLEWRYGHQLDWRLVMVGLSEEVNPSGMTPFQRSLSWASFRRRYGMPFAAAPKARRTFSGRACRAIVAARVLAPGSEWEVLRALQLAYFTGPLLPDDDDQLEEVLALVPGIDAGAIVAAISDPAIEEAYLADKAETRAAEGSPAELQGKTRISDGPVRYTAPSLTLARNGATLVAGGFQPIDAYDVLVVNLDPTLSREDPPDSPAPLLARFDSGLTTQEVAVLMTAGNDAPDRAAAEEALLALVAEGGATRTPLGDDALWRAAVS